MFCVIRAFNKGRLYRNKAVNGDSTGISGVNGGTSGVNGFSTVVGLVV